MIEEKSGPEMMTESAVVLGSLAKGTEENVQGLIDTGCVSVLLKGKELWLASLLALCKLLITFYITFVLIIQFDRIPYFSDINLIVYNSRSLSQQPQVCRSVFAVFEDHISEPISSSHCHLSGELQQSLSVLNTLEKS